MSSRGKNKLNFRENVDLNPGQYRLNMGRADDTDILNGAGPRFSSGNQLVPASSQVAKLPIGNNNKKVSSSDALLLSIKEDTASTRLEMIATRNELKGDINRISQRAEVKFKSIETRLQATDNDIKSIFSRIRAIESGSSSVATDFELQKQNRLRNNISIANVPTEERENLFDIFAQILAFIGCSRIEVHEVADAKRVHSSKSNLIIIRLVNEGRKLEIMKKKAGVKIMAADIFNLKNGDANPRIYINAQLTPFYSHLAYLGRNAVANNCIHSSFVTQYGFFVKLDEKSHPTPIANKAQLDQFIANHPCPQPNNNKRSHRTLDEHESSPSYTRPSKLVHADVSGIALSTGDGPGEVPLTTPESVESMEVASGGSTDAVVTA